VNEECVKLTTYFGERQRVDDGFLADRLMDIYAHEELHTSLVMRGCEGFGAKHGHRTDRLLTLSEDLPLVSVAVDTPVRIDAALGALTKLPFHGLATLERARMLTGSIPAFEFPEVQHEATKLTVYVGRQERANGKPAYEAVVDLLHRGGVAGATVLLGVDGTAHGVRHRAAFFCRNAGVPLMIISVGEGHRIAEVLPRLGALLDQPLITLERIRVCKRDGIKLAEPSDLPRTDRFGLGVWQKLMIYAGEQSRHAGHPIHHQLVRALREANADGATSVRGIWGFHGNHRPHGDTFWQLRRRVPVVTIVIDTPERIRRWFAIVDELTDEAGLVTSEMVPAFHATGPAGRRGGLHLAERLIGLDAAAGRDTDA
jgi:PII-like signaling protein